MNKRLVEKVRGPEFRSLASTYKAGWSVLSVAPELGKRRQKDPQTCWPDTAAQ